MMQAAALVFGMEPGVAVTASTYNSGTPRSLHCGRDAGEFGAPVRCSGRRVGV
jgi:hypothetical protein